jgi:hypothetical protein
MTFQDFAGVFSRNFVVGFFAPSFVALLALAHQLPTAHLPGAYERQSASTQILVLGGSAVVVGLVLSGLHHSILRTLEGYPIYYNLERPLVGRLCRWMTGFRRREFESLQRTKLEPRPSKERSRAAWRLAQEFPLTVDRVMPTRFGNVIRSFEQHPRTRYGLDGVAIWPRIEHLLTEQEQGIHESARGDLAFFVNAAIAAAVCGLVIPVGRALDSGLVNAADLWLLALLASYAFYRASVGAAGRWGMEVRASIDLHQVELLERLGVRSPGSYAESVVVGRAVSRLLLFGEPIPDLLRNANGKDAP